MTLGGKSVQLVVSNLFILIFNSEFLINSEILVKVLVYHLEIIFVNSMYFVKGIGAQLEVAGRLDANFPEILKAGYFVRGGYLFNFLFEVTFDLIRILY